MATFDTSYACGPRPLRKDYDTAREYLDDVKVWDACNTSILGGTMASQTPLQMSHTGYVLATASPLLQPTPPVSHVIAPGITAAQLIRAGNTPATALPAATQTLAGVPATFSLGLGGMFPLLILALVLYFIFAE